MENHFFLLKDRRLRRDLVVFLETVTVGLVAGYDLAFAWPQTLRDLEGEWSARFEGLMRPLPEEGFAACLARVARSYPRPEHRLWFQVLAELYVSGAPLVPTFTAMAEALRRETERDWEAHLRGLPLRTSVVLALFFLLPTLALVFLPLLTEMGESFR